MVEAGESHFDWSRFFLIFFFICFVLVMTIGIYAIFFYNANAPEPAPSGGAHSGMILPGDEKYAPHVELRLLA
jgi:hypothetical protein